MRGKGPADRPGRLRGLVDQDPLVVARGIAQGRMAIGAVTLAAPRTFTRPLHRTGDTSPDAVTAWRVVGSRDLALGLGVLLTARRASPALAGWLAAGALADAADVYALGRDTAFHPIMRAGAMLAAGAGAIAGTWAARRLSRP